MIPENHITIRANVDFDDYLPSTSVADLRATGRSADIDIMTLEKRTSAHVAVTQKTT